MFAFLGVNGYKIIWPVPNICKIIRSAPNGRKTIRQGQAVMATAIIKLMLGRVEEGAAKVKVFKDKNEEQVLVIAW